ncbi:MAG: YafY family protein [Clostridia bacterium]|nr:YafY family protein [Clostridia bacterium]
MYNPSTRLLTILEILQARGQVTAAQLAEVLEVSQRTVQRYICMLQDMHIPIETTRGAGGGYSLGRGFRMPPLMLTNEEAGAVLLGLQQVQRLTALGFGVPAETARAKIERVLPGDTLAATRAGFNHLYYRSGERFDYGRWSDIIATLREAAPRQRSVVIKYDKSGRETARQVDPYAVIGDWGFWYLVGYCHLRGEVRTFRVDRIKEVSYTEQHYQMPQDFNLHEYWEKPWGELIEEAPVTLLAGPDVSKELESQIKSLILGKKSRLDGSREILVQGTVQTFLLHLLIEFSPGVTVLGPPEVCGQVEAKLRALLEAAVSR